MTPLPNPHTETGRAALFQRIKHGQMDALDLVLNTPEITPSTPMSSGVYAVLDAVLRIADPTARHTALSRCHAAWGDPHPVWSAHWPSALGSDAASVEQMLGYGAQWPEGLLAAKLLVMQQPDPLSAAPLMAILERLCPDWNAGEALEEAWRVSLQHLHAPWVQWGLDQGLSAQHLPGAIGWRTPMHLAVEHLLDYQQVEAFHPVAVLLLNHGASMDAAGRSGPSPRQWLAKRLSEAGQDPVHHRLMDCLRHAESAHAAFQMEATVADASIAPKRRPRL